MLQSSVSKLASQFKPSSGGQGESVSTQNVASDQEKNPSDQDDHSEGENVNSEGDPADMQDIPRLDSLRMRNKEISDLSLSPQSLCLNDLGGLMRIRTIRGLILKPMTFLILARLAL